MINEAVLDCIVRAKEIVAVGIALNRFHGLPGVMRQQLIELLLQIQYLARMDFDVRSLATESAQRLVNHHARIGQAKTLALLARRQQECTHARRLPDAQRADIGLDELHCIVNRHPCGH